MVPRWTRHDCGAVIILDLDNFKKINDTHGHGIGDQVLESFAGIVMSCIRSDDRAERLGGEEFVVATMGALASEAAVVAQRIISVCRGHRFPKNIRLTASAGVAASRTPIWDVLLQKADTALYQAKRSGKDTVEVFDGISNGMMGSLALAKTA